MLLRKQSDNCGCVDDVFLQEAPLCNLNQSVERNCVDNFKENFNPRKDCDCPNDCETLVYEVMMTKLEWPTKRSFTQFAAAINGAVKSNKSLAYMLDAVSKYQEEKLTMDDQALSSIQSSFGRFTVYFSDLSMTLIEERPVYSVAIVMSNFGGLFGLYLGFSVLTVLEIVDFGFDVVEYFNHQGKKLKVVKQNRIARRTAKVDTDCSPPFTIESYAVLPKEKLFRD